MFMIADTPSLGLLIGLPIAALVFGALLATAVYLRLAPDKYNDLAPFRWGALGAALVVVLITAFAMWPWEHDYHYWVPVRGKVERISSRFLSNGDSGTSQRFVVVIDGQPYGIDDTRASLLKIGDDVRLKCKREYQWGSSNNGWGCRWDG